MPAHYGDAGLLWGTVTAVWGGSIFNDSISESRTASDSLSVALIIPVSRSESVAASDSFPSVVLIINASLQEPVSELWTTPNVLWGASGVWGGSTAESLTSAQIFANTLSEPISALDSLTTTVIFVGFDTESVTSSDSLSVGLVMNASISELGFATDVVIGNAIFRNSLTEPASLLWGIPNLPWGLSGVWGDGAVESVISVQVFNNTLNEPANASEVLICNQTFTSTLLESSNPSDTLIPNLVINSSLLEANGAIDTISASQIFRNFLLESNQASDTLSFTFLGSASNVVIDSLEISVFPTTVENDSFGVDISSFPDYDPLGSQVSGLKGLGQRLARRLTNPRGAWFWAPNECTDIRQYLNETITKETITSIRNDIEREALREEELKTIQSDITFNEDTMVLTVKVVGMTSGGPYEFVFEITSTKISILK